MRYVIIRDDDTNALTPVACLEKLYRPFLDRGLPVNLATIPEVRTDVRLPDGRLEEFVAFRPAGARRGAEAMSATAALAENAELVAYLHAHANPGYQIVQHGCFHDYFEFDLNDRAEVARRLDHGRRRLSEAGFTDVNAFVAPHDKLSRVAYQEVARRFRVISTGWFEWRRIPRAWWPLYVAKKLTARAHWRVGRTRLLSHPGCLLSYMRPYETMLAEIRRAISKRKLTVLVTHWWEYFRDGATDERFIRVLHDTAEYLASQPDICVTTFEALANNGSPPRAKSTAPFAAPAPVIE